MCINFELCVRRLTLISFFVLFGSMIPEYGPRQAPAFSAREDAQLLRTVLQDSISLLEQVGSASCQKLLFRGRWWKCKEENEVSQCADPVFFQLRSSLLVLQQNFALANHTAAPQ